MLSKHFLGVKTVVQSNVMSKSKLEMKPTAAFHNDSGDYFLD